MHVTGSPVTHNRDTCRFHKDRVTPADCTEALAAAAAAPGLLRDVGPGSQ